MSKSYTTTKRKLGITEQAVGAVLSSCSCDVGSRLPRSRTDLRDGKSKEVKSEFHFTLNVQGSSPDEAAIVFSVNKEIPLQKEEHGFFTCVAELSMGCCYSYHYVVSCGGHRREEDFLSGERREVIPSRKREIVLDKFNELGKCP